jgi:nucleotide-binding universal stress UspA family protein
LVTGTHGTTGLNRTAIGSVADALIEKAPCDVLVVRQWAR